MREGLGVRVVYGSLRTTPAIAAGVTDRVGSLEDFVDGKSNG